MEKKTQAKKQAIQHPLDKRCLTIFHIGQRIQLRPLSTKSLLFISFFLSIFSISFLFFYYFPSLEFLIPFWCFFFTILFTPFFCFFDLPMFWPCFKPLALLSTVNRLDKIFPLKFYFPAFFCQPFVGNNINCCQLFLQLVFGFGHTNETSNCPSTCGFVEAPLCNQRNSQFLEKTTIPNDW